MPIIMITALAMMITRSLETCFRMFTPEQQERLFKNIAAAMNGVPEAIIQRQLVHFHRADPAVRGRRGQGLGDCQPGGTRQRACLCDVSHRHLARPDSGAGESLPRSSQHGKPSSLRLKSGGTQNYSKWPWISPAQGETESLAAMLDHGLPVNLADHKGNSLLMLASYHGHLKATRILLEHGAEVERRNAHGQTPLGGAAFKGYLEIVDLFCWSPGADIEADNGVGMTPIMFAAMFGRTEVVHRLKARGASLKQRSRFGISARWFVAFSRFARGFQRLFASLCPIGARS